MNSSLSKKYGTPHNVSTGAGAPSASSKAAGRGTCNTSMKKGKFLPDDRAGSYGVKGAGK